MNYIYCGGYKPLLFALWMKNKGKKIKVITQNVNVINFCISEGINCIEIKDCLLTPSSISKVFSIKKRLDAVIDKINFGMEDSFFLTTCLKNYGSFYLVKELSRIGTVYYRDVHGLQFKKYKPSKFKPIFFKGDVARLLLKCVLGLDMIYYELNKKPVLGVDDSFFQKHKIIKYKPDLSPNKFLLDVVKNSKLHYKRYDNLVIGGGPSINIIDRDSLEKLYDALIGYNFKFVFKEHYNLAVPEQFKWCEKFPRYIPVELLFNNINKNIVAVFSASLILASQLDHITAISLLNLVEWNSQSWKNEVKEWLMMESNNKILFPESIEELQTMIN